MSQTPPRYYTYLLTIWEERHLEPDSPAVWRFRLEDSRTGLREGFATLDALVVWLEHKTRKQKG